MSEQRISLHPTAVSQPCTNCGVHGGWSVAGRSGTFTPPPGHTIREDGTMACPTASGEAVAPKPKYDPERRREQLCDWLGMHGIDPGDVPANAAIDVNDVASTLSVEVLVREPSGDIAEDRRYVRPNGVVIARRTVPLVQSFADFLAERPSTEG